MIKGAEKLVMWKIRSKVTGSVTRQKYTKKEAEDLVALLSSLYSERKDELELIEVTDN